MRFITEFKVPESAQSNKRYIPDKRYLSELKMGNMLAESFGWENPVSHDLDYHRLEIEAFPMDKWVEFRKRFMEALPEFDSVSRTRLLNALGDLDHSDELIVAARETQQNKQSGDAITNLSDQMEYRGPSSHCKACEDEKNGVKHIMAQKHTCRK